MSSKYEVERGARSHGLMGVLSEINSMRVKSAPRHELVR